VDVIPREGVERERRQSDSNQSQSLVIPREGVESTFPKPFLCDTTPKREVIPREEVESSVDLITLDS